MRFGRKESVESKGIPPEKRRAEPNSGIRTGEVGTMESEKANGEGRITE
jgi:hypothetical protein